MKIKWKARFPGRLLGRVKRMRPDPVRWTPRMRRWLAVSGACTFAALLTAAGLPLLHGIYAVGWIAAEHYHVAFAALCIAPAAAAHGAARHSGARGSALWLAWLPGIAAYAAFPWPKDGTWQPLWIFGHAWDWAVTIFLHWDTASAFAFNSFGAFVAMVTVAFATFGRLWLGLAKALGRAGSEALAPDGTEGALPSATWAPRSEIVKDFSVPGGIVLGELTDPVKDSPDFAPGRPRSWGRQGKGRLITMSPEKGNGHVLVTSQASGYKSTGLVIPNILTYDGPLVVFDPKCELYARCRKAREDMNFTPIVINAENGFDPARLIATLAVDHPSAYLRMAKMVIPKGHGGIENSQYFKDAATNLFTALLAHFGETGSSNILQGIAQILAQPPSKIHSEIAHELDESKLPFVQNELRALEGMDPKFWYSVKTEITNQLQFASLPDIEQYITMKPNSKLPSQVIDPRCDIFLNIPQNVAEDFAPMLRLMLGSMLTAAQFIEVNEDPKARRLFLIDEAAKLGAMDILENIRDRGRSIGLHLMMFYQTPGEIERLWGRAGMTSWRDGCSATIMGPVSSRNSAQDLSAMLGTKTLRVKTESSSSSSQVLSPMAGSVSTSEQEQLRDVPLISPTAISQLPTHGSIITATGRKPILASKAIWFTRDDMMGKVRSTKEIEGELAVTATREDLEKRLADMTQADDEPTAAASLSRAELEAMQRRNMDDDPEPEDAAPSSSEVARPHGPRVSRHGDRFLAPEVAADAPAPDASSAQAAKDARTDPGVGNDDRDRDVALPSSGPEGPGTEGEADSSLQQRRTTPKPADADDANNGPRLQNAPSEPDAEARAPIDERESEVPESEPGPDAPTATETRQPVRLNLLREAVTRVIGDRQDETPAGVHDSVHEVGEDVLGLTTGLLWLALDESARAETAVLASTHEMRAEIDATIRDGLAGEGVLTGREITIRRLMPLGLTRDQTGDIGTWREGDVAMIRKNLRGGKAKEGEIFTVAAIEGDHAELVHDDGRVLRVKPGSKNLRYQLDLHETATIRIRAGDMIRWTRKGKHRDLVEGKKAQVLSAGPKAVRFRGPDGRGMKLSRDDPQLCHLEHAYSSTVHEAQGAVANRVIAVLDSGSVTFSTDVSLLVEASPARYEAVCLTDSLEELAEILKKRSMAASKRGGARKVEREREAVPEIAIPEKQPLQEVAEESSPASKDGGDDDEWTKEERERAMALARDENISFEEIAELLGKSLAAVRAWSDRERARGLLPKSARESGRGSEDGRTGENA